MKCNLKSVIVTAILMLAWVLSPDQTSLAVNEFDAIEKMTIDSLANLYQPVKFQHKWHTKLARCKDCHHHTTGQQDMDPNCFRCHAQSRETSQVACKDCHTKKQFYPEQVTARDNPNLYHIDKPGLKGAYHLNCVPCHIKMNAPSHCEGCHALTEKGKQFFQVQDKGKNKTVVSKESNAH
jgi:hypothetical protein